MTGRRRPAAAVLLVVFAAIGLAGPVAARPAAPAAARTATVSVDFGDGRVVTRSIDFDGSLNGIEALRRAGFTVETYGFSGEGSAVCRIDGVGRDPGPGCLGTGAYWAYFHDGRYSQVCACATEVGDGGLEQWRYGTSTTPPSPPPTTAPPTTRPPTTRPPTTRPPTTRPPTTRPPTTRPPTTRPPTTRPPTTRPPTTRPSSPPPASSFPQPGLPPPDGGDSTQPPGTPPAEPAPGSEGASPTTSAPPVDDTGPGPGGGAGDGAGPGGTAGPDDPDGPAPGGTSAPEAGVTTSSSLPGGPTTTTTTTTTTTEPVTTTATTGDGLGPDADGGDESTEVASARPVAGPGQDGDDGAGPRPATVIAFVAVLGGLAALTVRARRRRTTVG